MTDSLGTYLHDHLAGAAYAIDLVGFMRDQHSNDDLGRFAAEILPEIKQDRDALRGIAEHVGAGGDTLKEAASWVGEKISRFKLGHNAGGGLATFEGLEFLAMGILGKRSLWRALAAVAPEDPRLGGIDFDALAARAQKQYEKVEFFRLRAAKTALGHNRTTRVGNEDSSGQTNRGRAGRTGTLAGSIAITAGALLVVVMLPDIARYIKIRTM